MSKVPDHRHCPVCGKVIPPNVKYCSTKCEAIDTKRKRELEFTKKLIYLLIFTLFIITIVSFLSR
ncbi:MAG: DUF2116 family Zn-ribbon domain-containing protein [Thermoprotei archaeon]|nr:MAG: DUF2116 family Zn-ribbon domain-containing protein [Thermoprotei archaeon]HDD63668.1 DUF2116 family Zn-ribbon domain-containing protein [Thermoprotei archaeon]